MVDDSGLVGHSEQILDGWYGRWSGLLGLVVVRAVRVQRCRNELCNSIRFETVSAPSVGIHVDGFRLLRCSRKMERHSHRHALPTACLGDTRKRAVVGVSRPNPTCNTFTVAGRSE